MKKERGIRATTENPAYAEGAAMARIIIAIVLAVMFMSLFF